MRDKTPDILIPALRQYQHNDCSGLLAGFDYDETVKIVTNLQQQILDICQPRWIYTNDLQPDVKPHRNIEIAYTDSINTIFTTEISSRMSPNIDFYAWRELEDLQPPRTPHE